MNLAQYFFMLFSHYSKNAAQERASKGKVLESPEEVEMHLFNIKNA